MENLSHEERASPNLSICSPSTPRTESKISTWGRILSFPKLSRMMSGGGKEFQAAELSPSQHGKRNLQGKRIDSMMKRQSPDGFYGCVNDKSVDFHYRLGEEIARGACGIVVQAEDILTGKKYCCKTVDKSQLTEFQLKEVKNEAEVMLHLRGHPNIVTVMGVFDNEDRIDIVMEFCDGGSLGQHLKKKGKMDERAAMKIMRSALSVIAHAHHMNVLYRDIKPDNASMLISLFLSI